MKSKHLIISLICLVLLFFSLYVYVNVIEKGPYDNNQTHILDNQNIGSESNSTQKELYKILHSWSEIFVIEGSGYGTGINEWYFISVENSESTFMRSWGRTYYNNKPFTGTLLKYNSRNWSDWSNWKVWWSFLKTGQRKFLEEKGEYKNGYLVGTYTSYYLNDQLRSKIKYSDGKPIDGEYKIYSTDGSVWNTTTYIDGKVELMIFYYNYDEGVISEKEFYSNGYPIKRIRYNRDGTIKEKPSKSTEIINQNECDEKTEQRDRNFIAEKVIGMGQQTIQFDKTGCRQYFLIVIKNGNYKKYNLDYRGVRR